MYQDLKLLHQAILACELNDNKLFKSGLACDQDEYEENSAYPLANAKKFTKSQLDLIEEIPHIKAKKKNAKLLFALNRLDKPTIKKHKERLMKLYKTLDQ